LPVTAIIAPEAENMIVTTIESDTSSQIYKMLQRLDEYDVKFSEQEKANEQLRRTNEGLQRADEEFQKMIAAQQKTIAELSTNVSRVSYPSSLLRS
jgi:hypothetical protein